VRPRLPTNPNRVGVEKLEKSVVIDTKLKVIVDGTEYDQDIVRKFLRTSELSLDTFSEGPSWFKELMASRLHTFKQGYDYGYEVASAEAPNCDECDVHEKAAEAGPPESHYSQHDR